MSDEALPLTRAEQAMVAAVRTALGDAAAARAAATGAHHVVLHEEQLRVGTRVVPDGEVVLRKAVDLVPVAEQVTLRHEEVTIERVPASADTPHALVVTDAEIRIPILEERVVVEKRLVVREVVVVRRETVSRTETVRDTVRRERLVVDGEEVVEPGTHPAVSDDSDRTPPGSR